MKVYLDENNICHREYKQGYREAEHEFFDTIAEMAIECYRFIPEQNFIQCIDSNKERAITQQFQVSEEKYRKILYEIAVEIGALTEENDND